MKNLHLIPTSQPSRLHKIGNELGLTNTPNSNFLAKQHNIYITNDEEIKEGDWHFKNDKMVTKSHIIDDTCKKIILTTNPDLIKDGVQAIDDDFLEWVVNHPSCEEVEVEKTQFNPVFDEDDLSYDEMTAYYTYKIIIPKEENSIEAKQRAANYMSLKGALEPKQETLEEAAEKWSLQKAQEFALNKFKQKNTTKKGIVTWELVLEVLKVGVLTGHKFGAKWQQERMYSEEEVITILDSYNKYLKGVTKEQSVEEWFEQFKKK